MNDQINVTKVTRCTYDQIAYDYSSAINELVSVSEPWIRSFEEELLDRFLRMTKLIRPYVLDIGCGYGRDTEYLKQNRAIVVSADYSRGMLTEARKHIIEGVLCQMDMRYLGLSDDVFDGIWANGCIYHVAKIEFINVLKEFLRVLKPLGIFAFNFKHGIGEKLERRPKSFGRGARFFAYYTVNEMKKYLKQAGFEIISIRYYPQKILDERIVHLWAKKPEIPSFKVLLPVHIISLLGKFLIL